MGPGLPNDPGSLRDYMSGTRGAPPPHGKPHRMTGNVLARLGWWLVLTLGSLLALVVYYAQGMANLFTEPVEPDRGPLVLATILFVLSVVSLVWTGAPRSLRAFGALYGILGALLLAGLSDR